MKILIIIAHSPSDSMVINIGEMIARQMHSTLTLLHVVPKIESRTAGQDVLEQTRQLIPDIPVDTILCHGKSVKKVLAETHKGGYDLVILDACLGIRPSQQPLSAQAWAIVRRAPTSVLVVQQGRLNLEHILICTGGTHISEPVIEAGAQLASATGAEVSLLHVAGAIPSMYTGLNEIEETLPELLSTDTLIAQHLHSSAEILERYEVPSHLKLRHGVVADEILREIDLGNYDLIITGSSEGASGLKRLLLGDVVEAVIKHTSCPFLIVKKPLIPSAQNALHE